MAMDDIEMHMAELDLTNEENEELFFDEGVEEEVNRFELCIVGRFLTEKNINVRAMKTKLADLWKPAMGINIKDLKPGVFLFQFYHRDDMNWVIVNGPWTFDGALLVMSLIKTGEDPTKVKNLLLNYESCSGQSVNFQKSGVYFSANVTRDKQIEISTILGVHNDLANTKYLGLPSLVGRSKTRVFSYLKEKASKRIQAWQIKPISQAGKTVLIRNVAQAIPAYSMSCFLIPKTICQELEQMFNNYWWKSGKAGNQKGLNWLSWNNMSTSKSKGGLGFRNLYGFNIALLGKHIWSFLHNTNSLVSRIFKARYFPNSNILKAGKGRKPSFIWSGIWTAKEELCNGFRWVLGNGNDIIATKDPWLRSKGDYCVEQNPVYAGRNEVVSSLFEHNEKRWNSTLIRENFVKEDADAILALHIPQRDISDKVAWTGSDNGVYSAKSGYHFWYNMQYGNSNISSNVGWKKVWHLKVPHKVKIFIWRFCRNVVPVRRRLSARGLRVPITCPMCLFDVEHMAHLFFDCNFAAGCWHHVGFRYDWSNVEYAHDWLLEKITSAPAEETAKICVVLWGVWFWRNKKVWDEKVVTSAFAMDSSFKMYSEWIEARKICVTSPSQSSPEVIKPVTENRWHRPERGAYKVNVDASVFPNTQAFSIGMVIRDHLGSFIAGKVGCFPMVASVFEAETVGIREALSWIKNEQFNSAQVLVESDSLLSVTAIMKNKVNLLEVGEVVEDCKQELQTMASVSVRFVRKNANRVAHAIARIPCLANSQIIFTSPPTCLLEALSFDLSN